MIHCVNANENWVCDRFAKEWASFEDISRSDKNIFWLQADWTWNQYDLKRIKFQNDIVRTIHHIVPWKITEKEIKEYQCVDQFVSAYHFPSPRTAADVHEIIPTIKHKPYFVAPFWVNVDVWKPSGKTRKEIRSELKISDDAFVIGSFQRDTEGSDLSSPKLEKGPDIFCDIVEAYSESYRLVGKKVVVLLSGWRRQYVSNRLKRSGIEFVYVERPEIEKINELYEAIDMYIVGSRVEGGPQAIFECATKRVPIISTDVGGAELVLASSSVVKRSDGMNEIVKRALLAEPDVYNAKRNVVKYEISLNDRCVGYMRSFRDEMISLL